MQSLNNVETKRTHYGEMFPYIYSTLLLFWISQEKIVIKGGTVKKKQKKKKTAFPHFI